MIPIKTEDEIRAMRHGGKVLHDVLDELEKAIRPGVTTKELDTLAETFITSHEGCKPGFKGYKGYPCSICTSVNNQVVHGIPDNDCVLKEGDIVGVDCGVFYNGLHTDACRTMLVGQVKPEVQHFVKTTKKTLFAAIKTVKAGARVGDISAAIQKNLEQQGYSPVTDCTGHGVGRVLHEPPEIMNVGQRNTGPVLKPGMTLAIEPISAMGSGKVETAKDGWTVITADNSLSAHFEHTVLVTEEGCEILT
jgi:methionyl aminopeptidase